MNSSTHQRTAPGPRWPDPLQPPDPAHVESLLGDFWRYLRRLPDLLLRHEYLLADQLVAQVRFTVTELMLALNGIRWPVATTHLNSYLSQSQRTALQKTLLLPEISAEAWIGCAVALVVIYRWYAPQLVQRFGLVYPQPLEDETLAHLQQTLADWPLSITTE
ncbi:MAG: hypothetical protein DCC55_09305 [Chloroflexi bacterium]|nr:MAG: hypothetical protein DCC55_09305 [Chloroflexota bacterium]